MTVFTIQIPDNKFVANLGMKDGKTDKIIIGDSIQEVRDYFVRKDMISMIHYSDEVKE